MLVFSNPHPGSGTLLCGAQYELVTSPPALGVLVVPDHRLSDRGLPLHQAYRLSRPGLPTTQACGVTKGKTAKDKQSTRP